MGKIILKDGIENQARAECGLANLFINLADFEELKTLSQRLTKPGNLSSVTIEYDNGESCVYSDLIQDYTFSFVNVTDRGIAVSVGLRNMSDYELKEDAIDKVIAYLSDSQAVSVKHLYPTWEQLIGKTVAVGTRFLYNEQLYKTIQDNLLIQEQYIPGKGTESLYARLDEAHAGTSDDPIPWVNNMQPEKDKYYIEGDLIAKCIEDPGQPLYHNLSALCPGRYFEKYVK